MPRLDGWFDPELEDLFRDDPSLRDTAHAVRATNVVAEPDPGFRRRLRAELMAEAGRSLGRRRRFGFRLGMGVGLGHLAFGGAALGTALAAATAIALVAHGVHDHQTIQAFSDVSAQHAVSPNTQVITISFNQPMAESQVVKGLSIRPATAVTTSWQGNKLVITPLHHLAGNTPYTVTIDKASLVTAGGAVAAAPVQISFGTAPTPPPAPSPPSLQPATLGPAAPNAALLFAPDGGVVVTQAQTNSATTPPAGSSSPSASASPSSSASPSAASSPSPSSVAGSGVVEYLPGGGTATLGTTASAAAFSPSGGTLALAEPDGSGGTDIVVATADGSSPHTLVDVSSPVVGVTWVNSDRIAYATATSVHVVALSGTPGGTVTAPSGYAGIAALAPGGGAAFLAAPPGGTGGILDVASGTARPLPGSDQLAAFSADGSTVAWVDRDSGSQQLATEPVSGAAVTEVPTLAAGSPVTGLALSGDGRTVAYVQGGPAGTHLVLAALPSGAPLAVGPAPSALAFSPQNDAVAMVVASSSGPVVQRAAVPGAQAHAVTLLPPGASNALSSFVTAQVHDDRSALAQLAAPSVDAAGLTPNQLSRAYQIDAVAAADGTVTASIELIRDPSGAETVPRIADEQLTLAPSGSGGSYVVTSLRVGPLHYQSSGPHVMSVDSTSGPGGVTLIDVSFDSDLNPASVPPAVTVTANGQTLSLSRVHYDVDSRTLTVAVTAGTGTQLQLLLSQSLVDIDGTPLATPFSATVAAA